MKLYGQITKVEALDDGAIRVTGVASTGAVDDADEQVLPEAMKAALPAYMRFGALREMHGLSAAGSTLSAQVGEDGATRIEALVVDPVAVRKVQAGVYKGFSIGGKVLARDPSDRKIITKLKLNEISLVDRPCNPEAVIDVWKAGGAQPAPSNADVIARAIAMASDAGKPGRHTDFVVKAREALVAEAGAEDPFDEDGLAEAPVFDLVPEPEPALKIGARNSATDLAHIQAAHDHLVGLGARCCPPGDAMGGAEDADDCDGAKAAPLEDLAKALAENARLAAELAAVAPDMDDLRRTVGALESRLQALAAQPAAPKAFGGPLRAVSKSEDADPAAPEPVSAETLKKYFDSLPEAERGQLQLRAALRQPFVIGR